MGITDPADQPDHQPLSNRGSCLFRSYIVCWCGVCLTLLASLATSASVKPVLVCLGATLCAGVGYASPCWPAWLPAPLLYVSVLNAGMIQNNC
jgi:hypothetical protein